MLFIDQGETVSNKSEAKRRDTFAESHKGGSASYEESLAGKLSAVCIVLYRLGDRGSLGSWIALQC